MSFPDVSGIVVPFIDPADGRVRPALLSPGEVEERRLANERRLAAILDGFRRLDMEPVVLASTDVSQAMNAFLAWADRRFHVRGRPA
jgi:NAD kinase